MVLAKGSTPMPCPFRPEHATPTRVAMWLGFLGAANTPTTGKELVVSCGQASTLLIVFELEAVYQRRTFGLKTSISVPVISGNVARMVPLLRSISICGVGAAHPIIAVLVSASISIPRGSHPVVGKGATMAAAPFCVVSMRSTAGSGVAPGTVA